MEQQRAEAKAEALLYEIHLRTKAAQGISCRLQAGRQSRTVLSRLSRTSLYQY